MALPTIHYCPATLAPGFETYSPVGLKRLFGGRKVSHVLNYDSPRFDETTALEFMQNRVRLSISGVQEKLSMVLDAKKLRLTTPNEQGTHILKPIPADVKKVHEVPANEHLTMQIARQVFGIGVAENGLVFFKSGEPAYITRRFDVRPDGQKWRCENFATLAGLTKANAGPDFKYTGSYEEISLLIKTFVPAWRVEMERFFTLVLFNFVFSNGDAHLKNFSLLETSLGDFILSPAYDLLNTRIHVNDTDFALHNKLFADASRSLLWERTGYPARADWMKFARALSVSEKRADALIAPFLSRQQKVQTLVAASYLSEPTKKAYLNYYLQKVNLLNR